MRQFKRTGLTLVELLAVIAIIGLLAGLLLPAVQSAREGGRRTTCASNLRQLGQGLQQFHAARGSLPVTTAADMVYSTTADPSAYMRYRRLLQSQTGSDINNVYTWIVGVMPFIEQQTFYDKFDLKGLSNSPTNQPLVQTPRANLICPSDPDANTPILPRRGFSAVNYATSTDADGNLMHGVWYAGSAGPALEFGSNQFCPTGSSGWCWVGTSDPIGAGTGLDIGNRLGMFGCRYLPTRFDDVQDGLSNVFLLVETQPKFSPHNGAYTTFTGKFNANPVLSLSAPINSPMPSTSSPFLNPAGQYVVSQAIYSKSPRSGHPGGCHMLMCDGAVVFFAELTPLQLLCRLGNRKDGEIAAVP